MTKSQRAARYKAISKVAREVLHLDTLELQFSDRLDFKEHSVASIKYALELAYNAGVSDQKKSGV